MTARSPFDFQYRVESQSSDQAVLTIARGALGPEDTVIPLTKVEGRWVPKSLMDTAKPGLEQFKRDMKAASPEMDFKQKLIVQGTLIAASSPLKTLLNANDQQSFNAAIDEITALLMSNLQLPAPAQ